MQTSEEHAVAYVAPTSVHHRILAVSVRVSGDGTMKLAGAQKALAKEQEERTAATYDGRDIRRNGEILGPYDRRATAKTFDTICSVARRTMRRKTTPLPSSGTIPYIEGEARRLMMSMSPHCPCDV